jgi:hypothetical protein
MCRKGARFSKERDHELFEYGVLVTHMSSKYATFEKEKRWQDGMVFFGRPYTGSLLVFEKESSYATFDTHSSNSYTGQDANFRKTETMRQSYPILDCTSSYTMCNFREEEITHNFFGCFFVARNPAVLILFEKQIIILILRSFWSRTYRGVKLFLIENEGDRDRAVPSTNFWTPT